MNWWEDSLEITVGVVTAVFQQMLDEGRCDLNFFTIMPFEAANRHLDVLLTESSSPNDKGFCSFGRSLWDKKLVKLLGQVGGVPSL